MVPEEFNIPAMVLSSDTGALIREHVTKVSATQAKSLTFVHTKFGAKTAPQVAHFSSRGPDPINPSILKPDIIAPGVDVLAAFPPNKKYIFSLKNYDLATDYALMSGTSMAAPHVAGVAALLKAVHREWSPATIPSAIMTTAYTDDNTHTTIKEQRGSLPATPLDFGAGLINPNKAMDPGLIYDMDVQDYIEFLCGLGYNAKQMRAVIRQRRWSCSAQPTELNYPSFMAIFDGKDFPRAKNFSRVVTNVGNKKSIYRAVLEVPSGMRIAVEPNTLKFTKRHQKQYFRLSLEIESIAPNTTYGYLKWVDQYNHIVSSPVVAMNH
ncbi:hypothetical protein Pyn_29006 [Prunus yedoensis var. nudiflora]|uniref:Uncharacterized protein n=1 Tax=Prunus yedoensis var. nudiflora TaxID=2094558 RepID=A0A314ZAW3_PRUYE|nr:hypothetical protein Pyn_29006 [Prunus yedoensis var. nudiflora]